MFRHLPISVRLALWYGLTLMLLLSAFSVFCYAGFHLAVHRDYERHLTHEQRELIPFITVGTDGPAFRDLNELSSVSYKTEGVYGTYIRLLSPGGAVRYRSPNFNAYGQLPVTLPEKVSETTLSRSWGGLPVRSRYVPLFQKGARADAPAGWLEVTGFEWSLHRELHHLGLMLLLGVLGSTVLALIGGWWLARRALRPVVAMTAAAGRIGARDLSARLPASQGHPDELGRLAETINELLGRLEASMSRERRFTANAAHELLTPLATLRSEAEVTLRRERDAPEYRETLTRLVADVERMTATVQELLHLARADRLARRPEDRLDFSDLTQERVRAIGEKARLRRIRIEADIAPGILLAAQSAPLAEVLDNLLSNAVKYTPVGGSVRVRLTHADREATLAVSDTGVGFDAEEADRLFDRLYRSDHPAVQAESGSGLGLAIVKTIVESYGGTARARSDGPGAGATFEVRLPCLVRPQ